MVVVNGPALLFSWLVYYSGHLKLITLLTRSVEVHRAFLSLFKSQNGMPGSSEYNLALRTGEWKGGIQNIIDFKSRHFVF